MVDTGAASQAGIALLNNPYCFTGEYAMNAIDFSPLYRNTVGFDGLFNLLDNTLLVILPMTSNL